ncbi:MAG: DNA glycosylase [Candidatus Dojkabacteria bacterium]
MNKLELQNYNLQLTLLGGQSFSWTLENGYYIGTLKDSVIVLKPEGKDILWQSYPKKNDRQIVEDYLNISPTYDQNIKAISKDKFIKDAIEKYSGLRILKQDYGTVLLNFILTSHKSIKAVRKLVKDLSRKYGQEIKSDYGVHYLFPRAEIIAKLSEKELKDIGAGFRAKYLKSAAEKILNDKDNVNLKKMSLKEAKEYLINFNGIGDKISDCVLVFGLGFQEVTPLDIWAKRVLTDFYNVNPKSSYYEMQEWFFGYFEGNVALAGQFLFEYIRNLPKHKTNNIK